jgi:hypothetical protein
LAAKSEPAKPAEKMEMPWLRLPERHTRLDM